MSQIMKAFTGVFMILFMMVTATSLLGAFLSVTHAQNLHAAMIDELENSHYAKHVIVECFSVAEKSGYDVEIKLFSENEPVIVCTSSASVPEDTSAISMAEILLRYPFQIAFFDLNLEQEIFGYAR